MLDVFGRIERTRFSHGRALPLRVSPTKNAMLNKITATVNAAKNAGWTMPSTVFSVSAKPPTMAITFAASARSIARSGLQGPVGRPSPSESPSTAAKTTPATRLTAPPNNADHAPCHPANAPAIAAIAMVAIACQR